MFLPCFRNQWEKLRVVYVINKKDGDNSTSLLSESIRTRFSSLCQ